MAEVVEKEDAYKVSGLGWILLGISFIYAIFMHSYFIYTYQEISHKIELRHMEKWTELQHHMDQQRAEVNSQIDRAVTEQRDHYLKLIDDVDFWFSERRNEWWDAMPYDSDEWRARRITFGNWNFHMTEEKFKEAFKTIRERIKDPIHTE